MLRLAVELEGKKSIDFFPANQDYVSWNIAATLASSTSLFPNRITSERTHYIFLDGVSRQYVSVGIDGLEDPAGWHGNILLATGSQVQSPISRVVTAGGSVERLTASGYASQSTSTYSNGIHVETVLKNAAIFMVVG